MRRASDPAAVYIRDWAAWGRYCARFGVPAGWLGEGHVRLLGEGVERDGLGEEKRGELSRDSYSCSCGGNDRDAS